MNMFIFHDSPEPPDNEAEAFIDENLSIYQAQWLYSQSEALGQTRIEILNAVLTEWFAEYPPEVWGKMDEGEVARQALAKFILRHYNEFVPVIASN
jgi:hypothetical protein